MKKILITTTDTIQNGRIEKYLDVVSSNIVIGTNIISDFKASFTDIFGGQSGTYQKRMAEMRNTLLEALTQQAQRLGGNAIIGLKIDFDELSGKGTSMLMASATGTAVVLQNENIAIDSNSEMIRYTEVENQMIKQSILTKFNQDKLPSKSEWGYLLQCPLGEIANFLCQKYMEYIHEKKDYTEEIELLSQYFADYIKVLAITDRPQAVQAIYQNLPGNLSHLKEIMQEAALFDPTMILMLINQGYITESIQCLNIPKESYSRDDLQLMQQIVNCYESLPDTGKKEIVKSGILSKTSEKFICENGHKNEAGTEYCNVCSINIKGLSKRQVYEIDSFKLKVEALSTLLDRIK